MPPNNIEVQPAAERLETPRLLLRQVTEADFDAFARMHADPEVMHFLGGEPLNRAGAWRRMAAMLGHWALRGFGGYAVIDKASGEFAGRVGFNRPEGWPDFEVGWTLAREHWGKGLATEAALACLEHAFEAMKRTRVISLVHPDNVASRRVAERIGECLAGTAEIPGVDEAIDVWAISAEQWAARVIP